MKNPTISYTLPEHRHRFASWTAARAVVRKFTTTDNVVDALERSGLPAFVRGPRCAWPDTPAAVDALHRQWAGEIMAGFRTANVPNATYGRAAKIIAVYLKTTLIIPGHKHPFANLAHPPIDRLLLQALAKLPDADPPHRRLWKGTNWTTMDETAYFRLIASLRAERLDQPAFWAVERYWRPAGD